MQPDRSGRKLDGKYTIGLAAQPCVPLPRSRYFFGACAAADERSPRPMSHRTTRDPSEEASEEEWAKRERRKQGEVARVAMRADTMLLSNRGPSASDTQPLILSL